MSCATEPEEGIWAPVISSDGIAQVEIRLNCQDQVLNGEPYPPGPPWYIHIWGRCEAADCDWGLTGAVRLGTGPLHGRYDQGFARRFVYLQLAGDDELWVSLATQFSDTERANYTVESWFRRAPYARVQVHEVEASTKRHVAKEGIAAASLLDLKPVGPHVVAMERDVRGPIPKASKRL